MSIPHVNERLLDERGALSKGWRAYFAGLSLNGLDLSSKQDANDNLTALSHITSRGYLVRLPNGGMSTRTFQAEDGIAVTNADATGGDTTFATSWPPFMARLSLGV